MNYVTKPVNVDAIQVTKGMDYSNLPWFEDAVRLGTTVIKECDADSVGESVVWIRVGPDYLVAQENDWVIKGISDELFVCKNTLFNLYYGVVN